MNAGHTFALSPPKLLQVFVSSPSDVKEERDICRKVLHELQRDRLRAQSLRIRPFLWEDDSVPGVGADAQAVVSETIAGNNEAFDFRIVVCILWTRLGTRTRFMLSGTVEEVVRFLLDPTVDKTHLLLYVSDRPVAPSAIDITQLLGVRRFLEAFLLVGGLSCSYASTAQFEAQLRTHLREAVDLCSSTAANKRPRALPLVPGDNIINYARRQIGEIDRLAAQAADNLKNCCALLSTCANLSMEMAAADDRGGRQTIEQHLRAFLTHVEEHFRYAPLGSGAATLKAARILVAFGGVLTEEMQPLHVELVAAVGKLLERQNPLIETVLSFCNTVIVNWPAEIVPIPQGSVLDLIRSDAEAFPALESEVQSLGRVLTAHRQVPVAPSRPD